MHVTAKVRGVGANAANTGLPASWSANRTLLLRVYPEVARCKGIVDVESSLGVHSPACDGLFLKPCCLVHAPTNSPRQNAISRPKANRGYSVVYLLSCCAGAEPY